MMVQFAFSVGQRVRTRPTSKALPTAGPVLSATVLSDGSHVYEVGDQHHGITEVASEELEAAS